MFGVPFHLFMGFQNGRSERFRTPCSYIYKINYLSIIIYIRVRVRDKFGVLESIECKTLKINRLRQMLINVNVFSYKFVYSSIVICL